jgi:PAS domain S-box-containing protein
MNDRLFRSTLDAMLDCLLASDDMHEILTFFHESIRQTLALDRVFFRFGEGTCTGEMCLSIEEDCRHRGTLELYGDRSSWSEEELGFLQEASKLIRLAGQKTRERSPSASLLLETAPITLFQADRGGNCLYVNPFWSQLTGFSQESALGRGWLDRLYVHDRQEVERAWNLAVQKGEPFRDQFRIERSDRSLRWLDVRILAQRDSRGEIIGYGGTFTDITLYQETEIALRETQQQLDTITANAPVAVYRLVYHVDGRVSLPYASAGALELIGVPPQILIDRPELIYEYIHPEDRKKVIIATETAIKGEESDISHGYIEYRVISRAGELKWLRSHANFSRSATGEMIMDGVIVDISEQKRALDRITFQASILDQVGNAVIATTLDGTIAYWNRHAEDLFLLQEEDRGKPIIEIVVSPEHRQTSQEIMKSVQQTGTWSGKFPIRRRDGSTLIAQVVNTLIEDENGQPQAIVGISSDISDRERLENAIRSIARGISSETGEEFFRSLVRYLGTVLEMDYALIGRLLPNQQQVTTIALYGKGGLQENFTYHLAGTPCGQVIAGELSYYPDRVQEHFPDNPILTELGVRSYLGTRLIDSRGEVIGLIAVFGSQTLPEREIPSEILQIFAVRAASEMERQVAIDSLQEMNEQLESRVEQRTQELRGAIDRLYEEIQERSRIEVALRKSEERYRNLMDLLPCGVQECDTTGLITYANPAHDRMYGFPLGTMLGTKIWERLANQAEQWELQQYLQFLNQEQPAPTPYHSVSQKSTGEAIDVQVDWTYLLDEHGQLTGYLSIISDVTERRQAEREMRKALDKEREVNQLKTDFINIASHEFRTPLTVILGSIQFLLKRYYQLPDERRLEHLQRIREAGSQIEELIEEMLTVGRADSGRIHLDKQPLDLANFGRELIEEMRVSSDNEYCFALEVRNLTETVCLDRKLLHHILTNLLFNAVKYSSKNSAIDLIIEAESERIIFTVIDRGIGIPTEDSERIFESFHRGRNVGDIPGNGLGLKIAKKYVEALQGTISFTSQLGIGSTFVVSLPL